MAIAFLAKSVGEGKKKEVNQWAGDLNILQKQRAFPSNDH